MRVKILCVCLACNNFPICHHANLIVFSSGTEPLDEKATSDAKASVFHAFKEESQRAYKNYKILYLRGVSHPVCYDDILPAVKTNYSDVKWSSNSKPKSGLFSIIKELSQNELKTMESTIMSSVINIVSEAEIYTKS